jgi:hypothetical protein
VGNFNTPLTSISRSAKQKINKEILELNHNRDQMDLADVCRIFHPTIYILLSSPWNLLQIDYIIKHKASLSKYMKIEIIPCILSDHNALKQEINDKNNSKKHSNNWKLNNTLLNDQWVIHEIEEKTESFLEVKENENMTYWKLWHTAKAVLRGKFIAMSAYIKRSEKSQINEP